jgi:hypothetical protein
VQRWLRGHPRFVLHFIPTSSSWLNLIERWFAELTQKAVRRGSFHSVRDLQAAIDEFLTAWNANPKPFIWTASIDRILKKVARCKERFAQLQTEHLNPISQPTKCRHRRFQARHPASLPAGRI